MHQLAATFRMILGDIDLTVTDRHVALVLAGSLQLLRRRQRVAHSLLPSKQWKVCISSKDRLLDLVQFGCMP